MKNADACQIFGEEKLHCEVIRVPVSTDTKSDTSVPIACLSRY